MTVIVLFIIVRPIVPPQEPLVPVLLKEEDGKYILFVDINNIASNDYLNVKSANWFFAPLSNFLFSYMIAQVI